MILKGSQRTGTRQLASHLLNPRDNDHVTVVELRDFVSDDLYGAMAEVQAVANGTRCQQPVFSLSFNPPQDADVSEGAFLDAADRAGKVLGLENQPRAVVIHEKNGRKHAHVVWSRIDGEAMKAINLPFFKMKLNELSKELYLEHGWELPEGYRTNGWRNPLNFTLAEWQQAKRLQLDPRETKQIFQQAWQRSDNLASFANALYEHGYTLARGDRRAFVALDFEGNLYSVSRYGVTSKTLNERLGDGASLPTVEEAKTRIRGQAAEKIRSELKQKRETQAKELQPYHDAVARMVASQRMARQVQERELQKRAQEEAVKRAAKFRKGFGKVLDVLTGRLFTLRRENERETRESARRDAAQREQLRTTQLKNRKTLQKHLDRAKDRHRLERIAFGRSAIAFARSAARRRDRGQTLGM